MRQEVRIKIVNKFNSGCRTSLWKYNTAICFRINLNLCIKLEFFGKRIKGKATVIQGISIGKHDQ